MKLPRLMLFELFLLGACAVVGGRPEIPAGENPQRWQSDIDAFLLADREQGIRPGRVVFVGSSSIRLWDTLSRDMAPVPVLNRGFGGSRLFDSVYYAEELVARHSPSLVVVFSGTNDIAGEHPKDAVQVARLFEQLAERLWAADAELPICYIAITPTLAREAHLDIVTSANRRIAERCRRDPRLTFLDPTPGLMAADGRPDPRWFGSDLLHLNDAGYAIWAECVRPCVEAIYRQRTP
jgi:lysophospholipase L1-like esterase